MLRMRAAPFIRLMIIALCFGLSPSAHAQQTCGELIGQVFDHQNNTLLKAQVRVKNIANGNSRSRVTDKTGQYRFPCLPPGNYEILASKEGFLERSIPFIVQLNQKNVVEAPDITLRLTTLTGRVIDPAGKGILNARVVAVNNLNGKIHESVTDEDGKYVIGRLSPGDYRVNASALVETAERVGDFFIRVDKEYVVATPVALHPAIGQNPNAASPQSSAPAPRKQLVRTLDAARSDNFSQKQMLSLPLGGTRYMRTFDELALLVTGVAPPPYTPGARGPGVGFGIGTAGEFSVNGMRARSNNFSIDGSDNNDADVGVRRQGFVGLVPQSLESINDFSIATLLWDAELGRNLGAQVNAVTKYGGNDYHGQAYAFLTDSKLNARNAFDHRGGASGGQDVFTRAQAGFVLGGPIVHDRTQFFGSFEHQHISASTEQHFSTPVASERRFLSRSPDFSKIPVYIAAFT